MNDTVIKVENLSKSYLIGHQSQEKYLALRDVIASKAKTLGRRLMHPFNSCTGGLITADETEEFWALKDISFEVKRGDRVGIIGRNGAGKSTLLKILSRITEPTSGRVEIDGRVASLLEVGTGFHPELTGRENIYLNGAILGMSRIEVKRKFDEIVDFAEVEKFLDTPVKRYSSGMYVRLAFAVAAHLEPEILIVDEVLAVGDAQFQKKCLGKMEAVGKAGRTVLFVSHNMAAVEQLTHRCLFLKEGSIENFGDTAEVTRHYSSSANDDIKSRYDVDKAPRRVKGSQDAKIKELRFEKQIPVFNRDENIRFFARVKATRKLENIRFSMTIYSVSGYPVGTCFGPPFHEMQFGEETEFEIILTNKQLAPGNYCCGVAVGKGDNTTGYLNYDVVHDILYFSVRPEGGTDGTIAAWSQGWGHVMFPELRQKALPQ